MERHSKQKPLLPLIFVICCLILLPLASSVPMSRSMRLRSLQHPPSLKLTSSQDTVMMLAAARRNLGGGGAAAARMAVEVNDYPGPGANPRHDPPKGPGRA